jgi:hypothetical protein
MSKARDLANAGTALTSVSATELGYLDGVTSAVQTQINAKQAVVSGVDDTEISYLNGVTSAIQTQLDAKQAIVSGVDSTEIGYLDGVTSAIQTQINTKAPSTTPTLTGPIVISPEERTTVSATAATGTINYDAVTQGVLYYTTNASANWTLNVRGSSGATLNSILATGDAITVSFLVTNGATAYRQTAFQIDGSAVTPKYSGGTAPAAGNASSIDVYTYTIIKTGSAAYTVFGAGPIKYA